MFKCSSEELFELIFNIQIHPNITVVTFLLFNIFNYTVLHYNFQDLPLTLSYLATPQHLSKQISTLGGRNIFFL